MPGLLEAALSECRSRWQTDAMRPLQDPLEVWMGGTGPKALERAGRLSDGWMPGFVSPADAGEGRERILEHAAAAGRSIDLEHFGTNVLYARGEVVAETRARIGDRRVASSWPELHELLGEFVDHGISKFVLRPAHAVTDWHDELNELASGVLSLQR